MPFILSDKKYLLKSELALTTAINC